MGARFKITAANERLVEKTLNANPYAAAMAFIRGEVDIEGDLVEAIRFQAAQARPGWRDRLMSAVARVLAWMPARERDPEHIRFHYDRSNEFYRQFLDTRMIYSCAYFKDPAGPLEQAQLAKLDHICRKLDLRPGERFLDIGCGWGGLVFHAAERYGAIATGCTLSLQQADFARERAPAGVTIREEDYRSLTGRFHKIASVGMFEHVGPRRLPQYFRTVDDLLEDDGLFLNHGIARPQPAGEDAQSLFQRRHVFPGGRLSHLSEVVRAAENAGFEILDVENLRPHYALTCRAWVERLQQNREECLRLVPAQTYRTWLLFLAASAGNFEDGHTDVHQVLVAKRRYPKPRRMSRDYMYPPSPGRGRAGNRGGDAPPPAGHGGEGFHGQQPARGSVQRARRGAGRDSLAGPAGTAAVFAAGGQFHEGRAG